MSDSKGVKIIQTVASGGTAVLYKAVQTSLDRIVAVKRLHQHLTSDENFTRRFILEAKAAASLDHENIVHVIDFGLEDECYQMVMEFVEGESLKEVLERWRPIRPELALSIVHQVCLGLEHAHSKGIVHRDIKPGNLMLATNGKIKIADFGLAKLTQSNTSQTAANSILGTPLYMSPEQAFGESVDHRSDLFSLGTVLYELLSGQQPFASENYMGVIQNIIHRDIPTLEQSGIETTKEISAIVDRALSRNRDDRFQSAREFREAIEDHLGIVRLTSLGESLKVLLDTNTNTQVLSAPLIDTSIRRRKKTSPARGVAATLFVLAAIGVGMVIMKPALLDQVTELVRRQGISPVVQSADVGTVAPNTYHLDLSSVIAIDTVKATPQPVETADTAEQVTAPPATTVTDPVEEEATKPAPQKKVVRKGYLNIESNPAAEVYVDGTYRGDTPVRLKLRAGRHTIECRHPRYESYQETLKIVKGELSRRNITLKKLMGAVSLNTQAGAELFVDGILVGITPIMRPVELDAGTHTLAIKKDGFFDWTSQVTIEANSTLPLNIRLSPRY